MVLHDTEAHMEHHYLAIIIYKLDATDFIIMIKYLSISSLTLIEFRLKFDFRNFDNRDVAYD